MFILFIHLNIAKKVTKPTTFKLFTNYIIQHFGCFATIKNLILFQRKKHLCTEESYIKKFQITL